MSKNEGPGHCGVLVPVGMLGGGFPEETIRRGARLGPDVIAVDAGSTDSGPYYLGASTPKTTREACRRDLGILMRAREDLGIPLIVGSCGTSGTDDGVDWMAAICRELAHEAGQKLRIALIKSEQDKAYLKKRLRERRVLPLEPVLPIDEARIDACTHIVGVMGHEPIARALESGAHIVLAGRATDTAVMSAVPLLHGCPPGPVWHAAKTIECGALCTTDPRQGGVFARMDPAGFEVEPLAETSACTPHTVAAHMLYENADPFRMREPSGTLDTSDAVYNPIDARKVRVTGSRFEEAEAYTAKIEGAAPAGFQALLMAGIRDPEVLARLDEWTKTLMGFLRARIPDVLDLPSEDFELELRCFGRDAVLGPLEPSCDVPPREVGVMLIATAGDRATANRIAKLCNPYLLHMPLPGQLHLPSFAFPFSPAEIERGAIYRFALHHVAVPDDPYEMNRFSFVET